MPGNINPQFPHSGNRLRTHGARLCAALSTSKRSPASWPASSELRKITLAYCTQREPLRYGSSGSLENLAVVRNLKITVEPVRTVGNDVSERQQWNMSQVGV